MNTEFCFKNFGRPINDLFDRSLTGYFYKCRPFTYSSSDIASMMALTPIAGNNEPCAGVPRNFISSRDSLFLPDAGVTGRRRFCNQAVHGFEHFFYQKVAHTILTPCLFIADKCKCSREFPAMFNQHITCAKKRSTPAFHICRPPPPYITFMHAAGKKGGWCTPHPVQVRHQHVRRIIAGSQILWLQDWIVQNRSP